MNWIKKYYPIGSKVEIASTRTGRLEAAKIVNHTQGSGFKARHTVGIIVKFDDGSEQAIAAAYLDESGGDLA